MAFSRRNYFNHRALYIIIAFAKYCSNIIRINIVVYLFIPPPPPHHRYRYTVNDNISQSSISRKVLNASLK